jgi:hypothetical protein
MKTISASRFASALNAIQPGENERQFLRAHYHARGREATVTVLAKKVGYKGFGGINLIYGKLAARLGALLGRQYNPHLLLLVDLVKPPTVTNKQWIMVMKPEFAEGLRRSQFGLTGSTERGYGCSAFGSEWLLLRIARD